MSSHHIIRDEQEPPVFIMDRTENTDLLKQLLGWSPAVWVVEAVAEWAMSLDIKIDAVMVFKADAHEKIGQQSGEYKLAEIDEFQLFPSLFRLLENKLYTGINIFCNEAQLDHILSGIKMHSSSLPVTLITDFETTIVSKRGKLRKWYPKGQSIEIIQGEIIENDHVALKGKKCHVKKDGILQVNAKDSIIIIKEF